MNMTPTGAGLATGHDTYATRSHARRAPEERGIVRGWSRQLPSSAPRAGLCLMQPGADDDAGGVRDWSEQICYQVFVRSFRDGNGDGIGDFRGLMEGLDYLQALGVTALWLNPIFP